MPLPSRAYNLVEEGQQLQTRVREGRERERDCSGFRRVRECVFEVVISCSNSLEGEFIPSRGNTWIAVSKVFILNQNLSSEVPDIWSYIYFLGPCRTSQLLLGIACFLFVCLFVFLDFIYLFMRDTQGEAVT